MLLGVVAEIPATTPNSRLAELAQMTSGFTAHTSRA